MLYIEPLIYSPRECQVTVSLKVLTMLSELEMVDFCNLLNASYPLLLKSWTELKNFI